MEKEIKKGSKEAKEIFESFKKRLENGEMLRFCWVKDYEAIFTDKQIQALCDLELSLSKKETEDIKQRTAELKMMAKFLELEAAIDVEEDEREIEEMLLRDFENDIKDLPEEEKAKKREMYQRWLEYEKRSEQNQEIVNKAKEEEHIKLKSMPRNERVDYIIQKLNRGRKKALEGEFAGVEVLDLDTKE